MELSNEIMNINFVDPYLAPSLQEIVVDFGGLVLPLLAGDTNVTSVIADRDATINSGKVYITTTTAFYVIDLAKNQVIDKVSGDIKGSSNELLEQDDIVDLNIGG